MAINYYVELLSRIRSVSVIVENESACEKLEITGIKQLNSKTIQLTIQDQDSPLCIPLPTHVPQIPNISQMISQRGNIASIRLPLTDVKLDRSSNQLMSMSTNYKWNSSYLTKKLQIYSYQCIKCDYKILKSDNIESVLDMPSSLWAEMMDFWHCHKPETGAPVLEDRFKQFKPKENGIITGPYYFAFNYLDENHRVIKDEDIHCFKCKNCEEPIGESSEHPNNRENLDRLFYWNLKLVHNKGTEDYKPYYHTIDTILDNVNGTATRIIEFKNPKETTSLLIWVFNIGLDVMVKDVGLLKDCIKVYYTSDPADIEEERTSRGEIEVIDSLDLTLDNTMEHLTEINSKLPLSVRSMGKHWKLGLLSKS